jgi:sterol desaturase/sphingolipid hydroxylase (fatty acid hydroxylase superfamily)
VSAAVDMLRHWLQPVLEIWRSLGPYQKATVYGICVAVAFYLLVMAIERACGTRRGDYGTRDFAYDMAWWFYYRSGLNYVLLVALLYPPLSQPIPWLDLGLLQGYPIAVQALVFFVVGDFFLYWNHRASHHFGFLWAFHTTHHAPAVMTFASTARFHPVEVLETYIGAYLLARVTGADPMAWLPALVFMEVMLQTQHTRIPWTLGPLYRVFVTPTFHTFHHSIDPAHHDRNFGSVLSVWDHLFGTAVPYRRPLPERLGVEGVRHDSLWSTFAHPFGMLAAQLRRRARPVSAPAAVERT